MKTTKMIFVLALIVYTLGACSSKSEEKATIAADGTKTVEFSFWLGKGEDAQYYPSYEENPILKEYLSKTYVGKDDVATSIQLSFQTPPIGSEKDNLSTLIATGDYTDIIDVDYYSGTVTDLYNEGIALDLTEYVEKYMPNYLAYLEKNPDLALTATNTIDGEKKYLSIRSYNTYVEQWQGFEYRRDWLVNYGKHPVSGEAFSGQFTSMKEDGTPDTNSWSDNVVFPSGGSHPV
ncbi:MAG: extracellular solute-binding protein, partial [Vallitaleaceae bacterium]|nr:extracellular solute-binding protein [Vallitaleaceae bacterium]